MLSIVFLFLWQASGSPAKQVTGDCVLTEGRGADFAVLGVTKQNQAGRTPPGVQLLYKDNVLDEIFAYGDQCRTSRGVRVGDSETQVEKTYGRGKKTVVYLHKGKNDPVGKISDFVLEYSGVAFAITNHRVTAIFIRSNVPAT